ncbi:MAG: acyltransferase [Sphingomonadaceae bacterium]
MPIPKIADRLASSQYRPSGFDYMRLILAVLVIVIHAPVMTYGDRGDAMVWQGAWLGPVRFVIPMFFALSGFLVAASFERCATLVKFMGLRVIRIWPALVVETLLSALILGPLLTKYDLREYFTDPLFWHYTKNILGEPQYYLPGLFTDNPNKMVNFQLWTVPFELGCYLAMAAVGVAGGKEHRIVAPIAAALVCSFYFAARVFWWHEMPSIHRPLPGPLLVVSFLAGVSAYRYRELLPASHTVGLALIVVCYFLLTLPDAAQFILPFPMAWLTGYLGTMNPPRVKLLQGADYSYGLYLYGFPLSQTLVHLFPATNSWVFTAVGSLVFGALFAAFSWHLVEKPVLGSKVYLDRLEGWWLGRKAKGTADAA